MRAFCRCRQRHRRRPGDRARNRARVADPLRGAACEWHSAGDRGPSATTDEVEHQGTGRHGAKALTIVEPVPHPMRSPAVRSMVLFGAVNVVQPSGSDARKATSTTRTPPSRPPTARHPSDHRIGRRRRRQHRRTDRPGPSAPTCQRAQIAPGTWLGQPPGSPITFTAGRNPGRRRSALKQRHNPARLQQLGSHHWVPRLPG